MFILGLVVSILSFILFPILFKIILPEYDLALLILMLNLILILVPLRYFSSYISVGYITPAGYIKISTITLIIFGVLNVILDIVLIKKIGFIGVIYATLISQFLFIIIKDSYFYLKIRKLTKK